ncbi:MULTISPECIES: YolD-like family protein [Oceanobacillus]|nr:MULTISPECIES: YolD-like family protein [Oceanobacillus]
MDSYDVARACRVVEPIKEKKNRKQKPILDEQQLE